MFNRRKKVIPAPLSTIPKDAIPFLKASDLLSPHKQLIKKLRDDSGASKDFFDRYYIPAIERLAEILQLRPFGHEGIYAKKGGAIEVAIKRVALSLKLRQGALLPLNCKPEEISHRGECWTYGVFAGALLREFGGQLLSVKVIGFSKNDKSQGEWHGWYESLTKYHHYRMKKHYNVSRSLSQTSSIIHLTDILPAHGLEWMYADKELMDNLLDLLAGANKIRDNPIQNLIVKASITLKDTISFEAAQKKIKSSTETEVANTAEIIDRTTGEVLKSEQPTSGQNSFSSQNKTTKQPEQEPEQTYHDYPPTAEPVDSVTPEEVHEELTITAENFTDIIRSDLKKKRLSNELGEISGDQVQVMYPAAFRSYTSSPSELLDQLRTLGKVVKEMERKGKTLNRKIILK